MEATQELLNNNQVFALSTDLIMESNKKLKEEYPNINKYELENFTNKVLSIKIRAILCTLNSVPYERIVKVVFDKLNLNDLFDNRQKYLN